jgi:hypothetical protein
MAMLSVSRMALRLALSSANVAPPPRKMRRAAGV